MTDYNELKPFATPRQLEYLEALEVHDTQADVAEAMGVNKRTIERCLEALRAKRAKAVPAAHMGGMDAQLPEGYTLSGVSTNYNGDGTVKQAWVKTSQDKALLAEHLKLFVSELTEDIRGQSAPEPAPEGDLETNLLAVYPMGDPHVGMYGWLEDAEEDFDLEIAEADMVNAMTRLVAKAPSTDTAIILNLGDFFHADNSSNMTSRSGHILDVDTRWNKVMRVGVRIMITMIKTAALKHRQIIVRNVLGNHDDHSSMALSLVLEAYFEGDDRVTIETSPSQVWFYKHGQTLIGAHHGHNIPKNRLLGVMVTDAKEHWTDTTFRYWLLGHVHHSSVIEEPGCLIEYFRTLSPRDAWAEGGGYRSERDMRCIVYDTEFGEVERFTMNIRRARA